MPGSLPIPDPISNPLDCSVSTTPEAVVINKTDVSTGPYAAGDTITYQVTVTNTSTTDMSQVSLSDSLSSITITSDPLGLFTGSVCLNGGYTSYITYDYVVTYDNYLAGNITNTVTLTSSSISAQDTHIIGIDNVGVMNVSKKVISNTIYTLGSTISYQVDVWNSGGSNVDNVKLTDTLLGGATVTSDLSGILGEGRTFAPGSAATCTYDYIVTAADSAIGSVTNEASIIVQTGSNLPQVIFDSTTTPLIEPGQFAVQKSIVGTGSYDVGDTITYDISIINLTPITVTGITIIDDLAPITYVSGNNSLFTDTIDLAPNESAFVRYSYTAALSDIGTTLINTATLTAANTTTQVVSAAAVVDDAPVWDTVDTFWETTSTYGWDESYEDFA